jgi:septal ring factor EnvC (AmiA/AmiB activator)
MSLLDEIAATNDAQIAAIDAELERLKADYQAQCAELKAARSILVGRRKRLDKDRDNGQSDLPFEPASATVVTEHLARVEREAEEEGDAAEHRLAQAEREAEGEDMDESDRMHAAHPVFTPPDPDVEPRLRRRRGVERGS